MASKEDGGGRLEIYAVPWLEWLKHPFQELGYHRFGPKDLVWQDPVTGSCFGMEQDAYDTYLAAAESWLKAGHPAQAYVDRRHPFGKGGTSGSKAAGTRAPVGMALPYPRPLTVDEAEPWLRQASQPGAKTQQPLVRTRFGDFLQFRVALFFSLFHPEVTDRWADLRNRLWSDRIPTLGPEDAERLSLVEELLETGRVPEGLQGRHLLFVKGGTVRIKQYYVETSDIQITRGGSKLLDDLSNRRLFQWIEALGPERGWTEESVVYSGGGRTLLALPLGARGFDGEPPELAIEDLYGRVTITAESAFVSHEVPVEAWTEAQFPQWMRYLETRIIERQMSRPPTFYSLRDETPDLSQTLNFCAASPYRPIGNPNRLGGSCEFCHFRPALYRISRQNGESRICQSCYHRAIVGSSKNRTQDLLQVWKMAEPFTERPGPPPDPIDPPESLTNIGQQIAVVYGDVNNLGQMVQNQNTPLKLRYFSDLVDTATQTAACLSLVEQSPGLRFELIAMAGDDLFFVASAKDALSAVPNIIKRLDLALRRYPAGKTPGESEETMTLSVGIALGASDQSFLRLHLTAEELLKSAKTFKKKKGPHGENVREGTVDFLYLKQSIPYAGRLTDYRLRQRSAEDRRNNVPICKHFYARPYTMSDFRKLVDFVGKLKQVTSQAVIRQLCDAAESMHFAEADLYAAYLIFRPSMAEKRSKFIHLLKNMDPPADKQWKDRLLWLTQENHHYCVWHDVLELWDLVEAPPRRSGDTAEQKQVKEGER